MAVAELVQDDDVDQDAGEGGPPLDAGAAVRRTGVPVMTETGMPTSAAARARANPGCSGGAAGQADEQPDVAHEVGQHVPAEQREVEHDDEEAPGGPGETRHGAHPRRVGTGAGRPSAHRCDPVDRRQPRHADRRSTKEPACRSRRSGRPPSPPSTGRAPSAAARRCPPTAPPSRRRPGKVDVPPRLRLRRRVGRRRGDRARPTARPSTAGGSCPACSSTPAERDLGVELFGRRHASPLLVAPIGVLSAAHADADLAVARAAREQQVTPILSTQASVPMEEVAAALGGAGPLVPALLEQRRRPRRQPGPRGPRRAAARRSSSPSTRHTSAGGRATSTSGTCRSRAARASRSTPPTRCSSGSSPSGWPPRRRPSPSRSRGPPRRRCARWCR